MYCSDTEFSENFFGALVRTFVMFTGELEYTDFEWKKKTREEGGLKRSLAGIFFGKSILFAFAFFFVVVVMNLLNAIAIGDIEVIDSHFVKYCKINKNSPKPKFNYRNSEKMPFVIRTEDKFRTYWYKIQCVMTISNVVNSN